MGDFRIKYGSALGPYANFFARTDNTFAVADTTPDVTDGSLFYTINTSTTVITHFDLSLGGGGGASNASAFEGKYIRVVFLDGSTTVANAGRLILSDTANNFPVNSSLDLVYHNSSWFEVARSINDTSKVVSLTFAGTGAATVTQNTVTVLLVPTATTTVLAGISGGYIGQTVALMQNTNGITMQVVTQPNFMQTGTSAFVANASGVYYYTKVDANLWRSMSLIRP